MKKGHTCAADTEDRDDPQVLCNYLKQCKKKKKQKCMSFFFLDLILKVLRI